MRCLSFVSLTRFKVLTRRLLVQNIIIILYYYAPYPQLAPRTLSLCVIGVVLFCSCSLHFILCITILLSYRCM